MTGKFSKDGLPATGLKVNPGRIIDGDKSAEDQAFMHAVVAGLTDLEAGREYSLEEAKSRLDIK
ncbi:prevent-host-death family protein [Thiohalophilus thiocyanatoxydans]|uniref:Uncharacterized protein n=1 Tax=Thiohalophilus thiocyanatoxydans TaxID=381308 RepID=A0A4R8IPK7_9GAMM|nr:prevent-host-death family protein [Thiohalophilus thiocyanatoxydans]TDY02846.1 hypothetical protein EDC23_1230 [Thiohalophilus thiocyanatoxydans]